MTIVFRRRALVRLRKWLLAAPVYSDELLSDAQARFAGQRNDLGLIPWSVVRRDWDRPAGCLAPWVDTLDFDVAAGWLYDLKRNLYPVWPPATKAAGDRLLDAWRDTSSMRFSPASYLFDVGDVFGQRGMPYPPDPRLGYQVGDPPHVETRVWLAHLVGRKPARLPVAEVLPDGHSDVLGLIFAIMFYGYAPEPGDPPNSLLLRASGSVYRDTDDRIVVLWRERER